MHHIDPGELDLPVCRGDAIELTGVTAAYPTTGGDPLTFGHDHVQMMLVFSKAGGHHADHTQVLFFVCGFGTHWVDKGMRTVRHFFERVVTVRVDVGKPGLDEFFRFHVFRFKVEFEYTRKTNSAGARGHFLVFFFDEKIRPNAAWGRAHWTVWANRNHQGGVKVALPFVVIPDLLP